MFTVIEGVYQQGKILIPQRPHLHEYTRVFIFAPEEPSPLLEKTAHSKGCREILLEMPANLDAIDVSISSKAFYQAQLENADKRRQRKKTLHSPFFSSPPVDIGYTDASVIDTIFEERT